MFRRCVMVPGVLCLLLSWAALAAADVYNMPSGQTSLQFVTVGDPGNAPDPATGNLYGSVAKTFQMGKYDVTVGQYTAFLNAVAKTDTYGLYNSYMATDYPTIKITKSGNAGSYSYAVSGSYAQAANCPIFDVSWGDAARFCNWLQNGQPNGSQGIGTTETGAYTLSGATSSTALMAVTRNAGATYFIPSENEWYKAAYFDPNKPGGAGYWRYPTQSNDLPSNVLDPTGANNANFYDAWGSGNNGYTDPTNHLTPVGAFTNSPGAYGTFDMGGNVFQWDETAVYGSLRGIRGGGWFCDFLGFTASDGGALDPTYESGDDGFRVASVPEPGSLTLLAGFAVMTLLYCWRKLA